jgi:dTDP-4-amino-4,6-dideoxygalactose transaminase
MTLQQDSRASQSKSEPPGAGGPVPFLDITRELDLLRGPLLAAMERVLAGGRFILGPEVRAFEAEAAETLGVRHAIGVNSGTDALVISLRALGVGPGDEVITSPFTFISTAEAISLVGARPIFADIRPGTFNLDPEQVVARISAHTKALLPVHLYGQPADMQALRAIADEHDLVILEDAAQAFGATHEGKPAGALGDAAAFSFYPTKNLGGCGDGGLVTTDDDEVAGCVRRLHGHGASGRDNYVAVGYNSRLDELQAALLRVKLPHVDDWNESRRKHAARYDEALGGIAGVTTPARLEGTRHVYHQYTLRIEGGETPGARRDAARAALAEVGIGSMVYYSVPLHRLPVYDTGKAFPEAERAALEVLSLPIAATLTGDEQERVIAALLAVL